MKNLRLLPVLLLTAFISFPLAAQAQLSPGTIRAFNVVGDVQLVDAAGSRPLTTGTSFTEGMTVVTGPASSVTLVQSNGSVIVLEEETSLSIEEFLQEPFNMTSESYLDLEEDPSRSRTRVRLNFGEATGETKRLRPDSSYEIMTPTGSAGIRGTIWNIRVIVEVVNGIVRVAVTVTEGQVDFNNVPVPAGFTTDSEGNLGSGATESNFTVDTGSVSTDQPQPTPESIAQSVMNTVMTNVQAANNQQQQLAAGQIGQDAAEAAVDAAETTAPPGQQGGGGTTTPPGDAATAVEEFSPAGG